MDRYGNERWFKVIECEKFNGFRFNINLKHSLSQALDMDRLRRENIDHGKKGRKEMKKDFRELGGEKLLDSSYKDLRFPPCLRFGDDGKKRHAKGLFFNIFFNEFVENVTGFISMNISLINSR